MSELTMPAFEGGQQNAKKRKKSDFIPSVYLVIYGRKYHRKGRKRDLDDYHYVPIGEIRTLPTQDFEQLARDWADGKVKQYFSYE